MVTLRMTVGREENGRYVLGNGLALGSDSAPISRFAVPVVLSRRGASGGATCDEEAVDGVGELWVARVADEQAAIPASSPAPSGRNRMR
jgi:hypothetical protein